MCLLWCICLSLIAHVCGQTAPKVVTSVGEIHGIQDDFIKYLGVPYASVDEFDPFGPADPVRFNTPFYAFKDPDICPQNVQGKPHGKIQCLNLNIYKPITDIKTLPVMVFIHGGGFQEGDGNLGTYSPKYLVERDVLVVTVNYRLGPYGFICPKIEKYINQGYKDQELALKWVKNNIKDFGGNENNIVLFGHSAGSVSADYHMSSNKEKYFNKVILQSAVQVFPLMTNKVKGHDYLADIATKIGINTKDLKTTDTINELSKLETHLLINVTQKDIFRPCDQDFTINTPANSYLKDIKIIIGNTNKELLLFYKDVKNYTDRLKTEMKENFDNITDGEIAKVEKLYLKGDIKSDTIDFSTDFNFVYPIVRSIRHYLKHGATVYRYIFSYDGKRNLIKVRDNIDGVGATHGDELGYLFDSDILNKTLDARDREVINVITTYWTNFAKYGKPYGPDLALWPTYTEDTRSVLSLGSKVSNQVDYRKDQMKFWDSFYKTYGVQHKGFHYEEEIAFRNGGARLDLSITYIFVIMIVRYLVL